MKPIQASIRGAHVSTPPSLEPSDVHAAVVRVLRRDGRHMLFGVLAAELNFRYPVELLRKVIAADPDLQAAIIDNG